MLRPIYALGVFLFCALIGMRSSTRLKKRKEILMLLASELSQMNLCMEYSLRPLKEIVSQCMSKETEVFFGAFLQELEAAASATVLTAWRQAMSHAKANDARFMALTEEDERILLDYARGLGVSDRNTQKKNAVLLHKRIETALNEASAQYAQKGKVYKSMGILSGVAIAILLW